MNILIIKLSAIGDVIHTLPVLNALRMHYPHARITWLIEETAASLIEGHPALDRVIVSQRKRWFKGMLKGPDRAGHFAHFLSFIRTLRDTRYDLIFDFQQLLKSGVPMWLAKGGRKIGFDRGMEHMEHSHIFLTERIPPVSMEIHALRRYLMLAEAAGVPCTQIEYRIPFQEADRRKVGELLKNEGIGRGGIPVAVNPVAQWDTKLWPEEKFAALADRLIKDFNADIFFTGGPADIPVVDAIASRMSCHAPNLAGKTDLKMLAALYERTAFVISTDTGPMHLSAATDTPVIALFGPTAPWRTGPFGAGHTVIRSGMECSPCFKRKCRRGDTACMKNIGVEDVIKAVRKTIKTEQEY
ncbi:MAG: lipopolysaccharide heptosyltransferase II [Desulfococcaceae bacterium]|jgi:3-deoxy-D-manno-octulosonic-acid transferase/heptosyltransferase-1|nr:lipopolysaccharide heptosyltransferase II [Desulfococcaceae bacterium]